MKALIALLRIRSTVLTTCFVVATTIIGCSLDADTPAIQVYHMPRVYAKRFGDLTANICGVLRSDVERVEYSVNDGPWLELKQGGPGPRVPPPLFTVEMSEAELVPGTNNVKMKAFHGAEKSEDMALRFDYDPSPIQLPITRDWSNGDLEVQDGYWETFQTKDGWRVRPKLGFEDYDRLLVVAGAFQGGRRIEMDLVFRGELREPYGFGILPMWGGRPDDLGVSPRWGWNFSLVWYYSKYEGVGMDFSYKHGREEPDWVTTYRNLNLKRDVHYFLTIECWPVLDDMGNHKFYRQRMKWREEGQPETQDWMELTDVEGAPIPEGEYAVALIAHRSSVDYGPVTVKPLHD